jgi:hypothetical protein
VRDKIATQGGGLYNQRARARFGCETPLGNTLERCIVRTPVRLPPRECSRPVAPMFCVFRLLLRKQVGGAGTKVWPHRQNHRSQREETGRLYERARRKIIVASGVESTTGASNA